MRKSNVLLNPSGIHLHVSLVRKINCDWKFNIHRSKHSKIYCCEKYEKRADLVCSNII